MDVFFEIFGTRIPVSSISDFRMIEVEFIARPVYREVKKTVISAFSGEKFEFVSMEPYAAIIGQQGHKSELGEYKAKDFKEALGKDIAGAAVYTIADKLKLKAFKHEKYQCLNLAGRAFSTYLDDVPVKLIWNDGRIAEVYKEDPLHELLGESTTPGIQYVPTLVIKAKETFCFYGNGVQIDDIAAAYNLLRQEVENFGLNQKGKKLIGGVKRALPQASKIHLPEKRMLRKETDVIEIVAERKD
ncbi:MAG: hypothetical protein IJE22_07920 [Oscillibacter sp.]|nr:hypothetical protein [Oscillibacter sp.]